jgi:hypothetical protein
MAGGAAGFMNDVNRSMQQGANLGRQLSENPLQALLQGAQNLPGRINQWLQQSGNQQKFYPGQYNCGSCGQFVAKGGIMDTAGISGTPGGVVCYRCAPRLKLVPPELAEATTAAFNLEHHKKAQLGNLVELFLHDDDDPEEAMQHFFDNLEDDKRSIIDKHKGDIRIVLKIKDDEKRDIDSTSKDLAMEG